MGILEVDIKQAELKEKILKVYLRRMRILETKLYSRNHFKRDKHLYRFPCKILRTILEMDEGRTLTNEPENKKKKKQLMIMHKALHSRDDVERY